MSVRQYVISDHPILNCSQFIKDTSGIPFVAWQQQMEKAVSEPIEVYTLVAQILSIMLNDSKKLYIFGMLILFGFI